MGHTSRTTGPGTIETAGISMITSHANAPGGRPLIYIYNACMNLSATWPALTQHAGDQVAVLQVQPEVGDSYPTMVDQIAHVLTEQNPWACRPWELLTVSEDERPVNRALGFWPRHGSDLGARQDAIEATRIADGWIRRAAANPIEDSCQFLAALNNCKRAGFRTAMLLPKADEVALPDGVRLALIERDRERVLLTGCVVMLYADRGTFHRLRPMAADLSRSNGGMIRVAAATEEVEFKDSAELKFADASIAQRWDRTIALPAA
jgi:hypothetical protein